MDPYLFIMIMFAITAVCCLLFALRHRWLLWPLVFAFLFRVILIVLDYAKIFSPPGAHRDGARFRRIAQQWSELEWRELFEILDISSAFFYSWLGAVVHKLVGISDFILSSMNFLFGHLIVALTALIVYDLFGKKAAVISAYIIALYPFAAFNSVISLREEVSTLCFLLGLYFFIKWIGGKSISGIMLGLLFFSAAVMFHPGWIGAFVGVAIYMAYFMTKLLMEARNSLIRKYDVQRMMVSAAVFIVAVSIITFSGGLSLGKGVEIGTEEGAVGGAIESRFERDPQGGSAYPGSIATGNPYAQPWLIPARIIYFNFAPFPWDIKTPRHLLGLVASMLYIFLAWRVYKGWHLIKRKEECIALLLIFGALTFIFAIGVTNIGTAIRHKSKFVALFVILAASSFNSIKVRLAK
ncbi:ArnT family glycosyltransferase [Halomonas sp. BC04]|uniref:ArnT family glycosyltransferase n=1 Tax=Halomonas sp. BC04 TaxID=1403540 RepID=UPI0003ED60F8|nr:glycosyltransferase family 39 protein [Halomonas sp. BC04]EWH01117.1 hypothetical protein Q427_15345 [Halomonas sp. BC04]